MIKKLLIIFVNKKLLKIIKNYNIFKKLIN